MRVRNLPRSSTDSADQAGNATLAAATPASTSPGVPAGMLAITSSVTESITSSVSEDPEQRYEALAMRRSRNRSVARDDS